MKLSILIALVLAQVALAAPIALVPGQSVTVNGTLQIGTGPEVIRLDLVALQGSFTATPVAGQPAVVVDRFAIAPNEVIDIQTMAAVMQHPLKVELTGQYAHDPVAQHHILIAQKIKVIAGKDLANAKLSPPWYYVHAQVRAGLEGGPVKVLELEQRDGHWIVPVAVSGADAATVGAALATLVKHSQLNGTVLVEVRLPGGTLAQALPATQDATAGLALLKQALASNPHVAGLYAYGPGLLIEMKPEILQFFADNISDRHGLAHVPAAQLFEQVLDLKAINGVPVSFSYDAAPGGN